MKALILTSSIFYLLGLKLTNQVEVNQQSKTDSIQIQTKTQKELVLPADKLPEINTEEADSTAPTGSNENVAPWCPEKETLEIK